MWYSDPDEEENKIRKSTTPYPKNYKTLSCYCPVCSTYLGTQELGREISLHCTECRAVYTWFPGVSKPTATLDKDIPKRCNCDGCRMRRGEGDKDN